MKSGSGILPASIRHDWDEARMAEKAEQTKAETVRIPPQEKEGTLAILYPDGTSVELTGTIEVMPMDEKQKIIKRIESISGKYSPYEVFTDWIRCCAIAISNSVTPIHGKVWKEREKSYLDTVAKYEKKEAESFAEMLAWLVIGLEKEMEDVLGSVYMMGGMGSKTTGQFFTPFHVSEMCGRLTVGNPDEDGIYRLNEPACGGGAMIIAAAKALRDKGVNYQRKLVVVAQDLDWKSVYMCYLQLSLLGIKATCVQGDTLEKPYTEDYPRQRVLYTPAKMGVLLF